MVDLQSLADRMYYSNRRAYTVEHGDVKHLDSTPLKRPITMPVGQRVFMLAIVAVAVVIGFMFLNNTILESMRQTAATERAIEENIKREGSVATLPVMATLINRSDEEIRGMFQEAGYKVFDASSLDQSGNTVLFKLPSDVSVEEARAFYSDGIASLTAEQATRFLNGGWRLTADWKGGTSMVVHYTDFTTGDPEVAIRTALEKEGFDPNSVTDSGVDDSGNTYSMGTIDVDGTICSWKISALKFEDMYSINGMPENACYVGVRMTKA